MTRLDDADLLETLAAALAPPPASPSSPTAHLRQMLIDAEPVAPIIQMRTPRRNLASRVRHPVAAAAVVVILATSSAAAAAVGTDTLPGPLRTVAVSLGLPVPSPALMTARGAMATLAAALGFGDAGAIAGDLTALKAALSELDPADLASVREAADHLVDRAELALNPASGPATSGGEPGRGVRGGSTQPGSVGGTRGDGRGGSVNGTSGDTGASTRGNGSDSGDGGPGGGPGPSGNQSGGASGSSAGGGGPGPSTSGGGSPGSDGGTEGPSSPSQGTSGVRVMAVARPTVVPRSAIPVEPVPMGADRLRAGRALVIRDGVTAAMQVTAAVAPGDVAPTACLTASHPIVPKESEPTRDAGVSRAIEGLTA